MGVIAGGVAFGIGYAARPRGAAPSFVRAATVIDTPGASFELHAGAGRLTVRSRDGALARDLDLSIVVDGTPRPVTIAHDDLRAEPDALSASVPIALDEATLDAQVDFHADAAHDAIAIVLHASPASGIGDHTIALRADLSNEADVVFVPGVGEVADRGTVTGDAMLVDAAPHPIAIESADGAVGVEAILEDPNAPGVPMHVAASSPARAASEEHLADLHVAVGASSASVWRAIAEIAGAPTAHVHGRVAGTSERAHVYGRDAQGVPRVRALAGAGNVFDLDVPATVAQWYAAIDVSRASALASFVPGTPRDLVLDVSPGGDLHVVILDADTRTPVTARLLVKGLDGTVDPSFGPDYRASGAGPVIDSLRGDVVTPLPSGRYRVAATKGIAWSIDAKTIDVAPGRTTEVELLPRHVVPTPGVLSCDLHVHARPSFDSPVSPEDRVLSLVAAGIDFAVPTEHNIVGDYTSALESLQLAGDLLSVPGVEVTTFSKGFGHFGVFPYPPTAPVPPFRHTTMAAIFKAVRADPSRYFQVNHPRLPKGIGYFSNIGFDPKAPPSRIHNRIDFDGIEVFSGYDDEQPERVEQVLRDYWGLLNYGWRFTATGSSDSHRIQFHWAGYPRTMVRVEAAAGHDARPDPLSVVANIKKGHAVVTIGPVIELELGGARPGDELPTGDDPVRGHLRVRAAPWIDVTRVEIVVGGKIVQSFDVESRPARIGPEPGTLEEAQARTIRFDRDIEVRVGPDNGWVQVIVRGQRRMDDVLPFMPVPPFAFTNPVYIVRRSVLPPPWPLVGRGGR